MPLVDVMLVLLIIFMVTAPMIQRGIDVKLPVATRAAPVVGERVEVTVPAAYRESHFVFVGTDRVRAEDLQERIRQKMENGHAKEVYLRGDATVQYQELMDVFDAPEGRRRPERRPGHQDAGRALMDVTDILRDRMQTPAGLQRMISVSIAVHALLAAARHLRAGRPADPPRRRNSAR